MDERRASSGVAAGAVSPVKTVAALVAGWLIPGAGHVVLGRVRRGVFFCVLILTSFGLGVAHDGRLALYSSRESFLTGLQVIANVGVGPVDLLARLNTYGEAAYVLPATSHASFQRREDAFRLRQRNAISAYGTAYLWTAGLMNLLLLLDVWDIARRRKD